jgi:hypothetical protein
MTKKQVLATVLKAFGPLCGGLVAASFLIFAAEAQSNAFTNSPVDATTWGFAQLSISREIGLFGVLLAANIIVILGNAFVYQIEIMSAVGEHRRQTGKHSGWGTAAALLNLLVICIVLLVWFGGMVFAAATHYPTFEGLTESGVFRQLGDRSDHLESLLLDSSWLALLVFFLVLLIDLSMLSMTKLRNLGNPQTGALTGELSDIANTARGSLFYASVPSILANVAILLIIYWSRSLDHLANGLTELGVELFKHYTLGRAYSNIEGPVKAITSTFGLGFAAGAHILQLFISQIVLGVLWLQKLFLQR